MIAWRKERQMRASSVYGKEKVIPLGQLNTNISTIYGNEKKVNQNKNSRCNKGK